MVTTAHPHQLCCITGIKLNSERFTSLYDLRVIRMVMCTDIKAAEGELMFY